MRFAQRKSKKYESKSGIRSMDGYNMYMVRNLLRLEGLSVLLTSLYVYHMTGGNWIFFLVLLFVPDISMIGYLKGKKLGAITYNLVHNYALAIALMSIGVLFTMPILTQLGLILVSHVGMDRFLGFGLKYPTDFKTTHIQKGEKA